VDGVVVVVIVVDGVVDGVVVDAEKMRKKQPMIITVDNDHVLLM
jgi:hypothetical protein